MPRSDAYVRRILAFHAFLLLESGIKSLTIDRRNGRLVSLGGGVASLSRGIGRKEKVSRHEGRRKNRWQPWGELIGAMGK